MEYWMEYTKEVLKETWVIVLIMGLVSVPIITYLSRKDLDEFFDEQESTANEPNEVNTNDSGIHPDF